MEERVVNNSGSEVAPARSKVPMNMPPSLVRWEIASAHSASFMAAMTIRAALNPNSIQITAQILIAWLCLATP
jgi:hypothetical protein